MESRKLRTIGRLWQKLGAMGPYWAGYIDLKKVPEEKGKLEIFVFNDHFRPCKVIKTEGRYARQDVEEV